MIYFISPGSSSRGENTQCPPIVRYAGTLGIWFRLFIFLGLSAWEHSHNVRFRLRDKITLISRLDFVAMRNESIFSKVCVYTKCSHEIMHGQHRATWKKACLAFDNHHWNCWCRGLSATCNRLALRWPTSVLSSRRWANASPTYHHCCSGQFSLTRLNSLAPGRFQFNFR